MQASSFEDDGRAHLRLPAGWTTGDAQCGHESFAHKRARNNPGILDELGGFVDDFGQTFVEGVGVRRSTLFLQPQRTTVEGGCYFTFSPAQGTGSPWTLQSLSEK